jgi:stalled ribosome alternative rescue factor ArfA|tara:strand:- start:1133 stop:1273 length:141 start_codon:yes stop_codon:yes gene_type:complete
MVFKLKKINPIARLIAYTRKRKQVVPPKKGKGSYKRKTKHKGIDIS